MTGAGQGQSLRTSRQSKKPFFEINLTALRAKLEFRISNHETNSNLRLPKYQTLRAAGAIILGVIGYQGTQILDHWHVC